MSSSKVVSLFAALTALCGTALGQSTAFTFQGALVTTGQPAAGPHDFEVRLFDSAAGLTQLGPTLCFESVVVDSGRFALQLDFGQQFAAPSPRFLEIKVRPEIGQPCTDQFAYVTLSPRQALSATPQAVHANSAFALDTPDGLTQKAVFVSNSGKVGVGTQLPTHTVHVANVEPTLALQDTDSAGGSGGQQVGYVSYRDSANAERGWIGYGSPGDPDLSIINARPNGDIVLRSFGTGRVGIGVVAPTSALSVAGGADFTGSVGIGTTTPGVRLDVVGTLRATDAVFPGGAGVNATLGTFASISAAGVLKGIHESSNGVGVLGVSGTTLSGSVIGVQGRVSTSDANSFGVFSTGRLGASGTKSFRIDHPESPATHYLFHYSTESPEAINFYRGTVVLDGAGRAIIRLPSYFAKINKDPSYQLTAVGAPMPELHVAEEISPAAMFAGEKQPLGMPGPACSFVIAGGRPGGKVSWRVEAVRNDEFVRQGGAPVELQKLPGDPSDATNALTVNREGR